MKHLILVFAYLFIALVFSGCSTLPPPEDDEVVGHIVSIGRDGELENIRAGEEIKLDPGNGCTGDYTRLFTSIFDGIRTFPKDEHGNINVLVYVHGGLNTKKNSLQRAQEKYKLIKYAEQEKKYPVFINWRSGPITTYAAHLTRIRQGEISSTAPITSPIYLFTDVANSIVTTPKAWVVQGEHSLDSTLLRNDEYLNRYTNGSTGILFTGDESDFSSLGRSIQWIVTSPIKVVTTPFVHTMARPAWDVMLRRTNTPFLKPCDFENRHKDDNASVYIGNGALSQFLFQLSKLIEQENLPVKITLVGHSMGAIVVNKMLNTRIDLPYENIVHMASADSMRNLFELVVPYIQHHDVRFYSLHLHPENEDREVSAWGFTPSGSLLIWIDNMFTTPETVMDRRSGRWENMERVLDLIPVNARQKMRFKIFGIKDENRYREPQEHGSFDDFEFWQTSYWYN